MIIDTEMLEIIRRAAAEYDDDGFLALAVARAIERSIVEASARSSKQ